MSADLLGADEPSLDHYTGDAFDLLTGPDARAWDLLIAHPPCQYVAGSGLHWNRRRPGRAELTDLALAFALALWRAPVDRVCIENPVGALWRVLGHPTQTVQPYQFGDDASKRTCLWLRGLPALQLPDRSLWFPPRIVDGRERWGNQTDSGQNRLSPSADRPYLRARTYPGIARAMAEQWGAPSSLF